VARNEVGRHRKFLGWRVTDAEFESRGAVATYVGGADKTGFYQNDLSIEG
jgi:hypothetical protein